VSNPPRKLRKLNLGLETTQFLGTGWPAMTPIRRCK